MSKFEELKNKKQGKIEKPKNSPEREEQATKLSEEAQELAEQGYKEKDEEKIQQAREMLTEASEMLEKKRWGEWQELTDESWEYYKKEFEFSIIKSPNAVRLIQAGRLKLLASQRFDKEIQEKPEIKEKMIELWDDVDNLGDPMSWVHLKILDSEQFEEKMAPRIKQERSNVATDLRHIDEMGIMRIIGHKMVDPDWFEEKYNKEEKKIIFETATKLVFAKNEGEEISLHRFVHLKLLDSERFQRSIPKQQIEQMIEKTKFGREGLAGLFGTVEIRVGDDVNLSILQNDIEVDPKEGLIIHYPEKKKS